MEFEDFPAAHSMDSGWFAVDSTGALAHFDTGEPGALPASAAYTTGEAGGDGDEFWITHVAPWIARNTDPVVFASVSEAYAVFDTAGHARAALTALGDFAAAVDENDVMIELVWLEGEDFVERTRDFDGFVGLAPNIYSIWEDDVAAHVPLNIYSHGEDWAIPGDYVRRNNPVAAVFQPDAAEGFEKMDVVFAETPSLNLADFYANDECHSWSNGDLRTGEIPPAIAPDSWLGRLTRFFKG